MATHSFFNFADVNTAVMIKRAAIGGGIALILIALFLSGAGESNPEWPTYWYIRPLLIVPLGGSFGGVLFYFMEYFFANRRGWVKALAIFASILIYVIGLWLSTVLGLDGTMWN